MDKDNDRYIDDLLNLTDSSTESSSSTDPDYPVNYTLSNQPFVLELHELKRDADPTAKDAVPEAQAKAGPNLKGKKKKKKKGPPAQSSESASLSEASSLTQSNAEPKEKFFDAHDSYHVIPENEAVTSPAAQLVDQTLVIVSSNIQESSATEAVEPAMPAEQVQTPAAIVPAAAVIPPTTAPGGLPAISVTAPQAVPAAESPAQEGLTLQSSKGHLPSDTLSPTAASRQAPTSKAQKKTSAITKPVTGPK